VQEREAQRKIVKQIIVLLDGFLTTVAQIGSNSTQFGNNVQVAAVETLAIQYFRGSLIVCVRNVQKIASMAYL